MKIEYYGHSCFRITAENGVSIMTDPYTRVGYELPKGLSADIVTVSHAHFDHNATHLISAKNTVNGVGVYELNGIKLQGIASFHDEKNGTMRGTNVIYKWEMDGLTVCHLGDLGEPFHNRLAENIGKVDVLLIPIGGTYTIDAMQAKTYVDALAPSFVIPMHYRPVDGTIDITDEKPFLNTVNLVERVGCSPVTLSVKDKIQNTTKIIFMERISR